MSEWHGWPDGEPPLGVNRVRWEDGAQAIRGAACEYEGEPHSHWAYVVAYNGQFRTPGPDSTRQDVDGWHCWLDLDFVGRWAPMFDPADEVGMVMTINQQRALLGLPPFDIASADSLRVPIGRREPWWKRLARRWLAA